MNRVSWLEIRMSTWLMGRHAKRKAGVDGGDGLPSLCTLQILISCQVTLLARWGERSNQGPGDLATIGRSTANRCDTPICNTNMSGMGRRSYLYLAFAKR
jgi:hypothetical protein